MKERTIAAGVMLAAGAYLLLRARAQPDGDVLADVCVTGETGETACGGDSWWSNFAGAWLRFKRAVANMQTASPATPYDNEPITTVEHPEEAY